MTEPSDPTASETIADQNGEASHERRKLEGHTCHPADNIDCWDEDCERCLDCPVWPCNLDTALDAG